MKKWNTLKEIYRYRAMSGLPDWDKNCTWKYNIKAGEAAFSKYIYWITMMVW